MSTHIFASLEQGSPEWLAERCGILTASVIGNLVSSRQPTALETDCPECGAEANGPCLGKRSPEPIKTLHPARAAAARELDKVITADVTSDTARGLMNTLIAERITGRVEPIQESRSMQRGTFDEPLARNHYDEHRAQTSQVGFMVRDDWGYRLGFSPDGLVGEEGLIEIKSRSQRIHLQTILSGEPPLGNLAQMQCGLLVSGREWCDYVSWSGGMPMWVHRVTPDKRWFDAIIQASEAFENAALDAIERYTEATAGLPPTEWVDHFADIELVF